MIEQNVAVMIHTDSGVISGTLSIPAGMRLSDFINLPAQFLHLKSAVVCGSSNNSDEIHVNKKAIKILSMATDSTCNGITNEKKGYPFVPKKPVGTKIFMMDYEVSGNLHSTSDCTLSKLLERNIQFLPCTDVTISHVSDNNTWSTTFSALNLNNISVLQNINSLM
jgi:hypothetical protein